MKYEGKDAGELERVCGSMQDSGVCEAICRCMQESACECKGETVRRGRVREWERDGDVGVCLKETGRRRSMWKGER